jgi:hypothetical protein
LLNVGDAFLLGALNGPKAAAVLRASVGKTSRFMGRTSDRSVFETHGIQNSLHGCGSWISAVYMR